MENSNQKEAKNEALAIQEPHVVYQPKTMLEILDEQEEVFKRMLKIAISATTSADWVDQSGAPYLMASGAEKLALRCGIKIDNVTMERENFDDDKGQFYLYTTKGRASFIGGKSEICAMGACSSRDPFFGKKAGGYKHISDVDVANIKRKSYTNFLNNAIKRLLGIRNLTWAQLAEYGITKKGVAHVERKTKETGLPNPPPAQTGQKETAPKNDAKKPYWTSEWEGKRYLFARVNGTFSEETLTRLNLRPSKKDPKTYVSEFSDSVYTILESKAKEGGVK